MSNGKVSMNNRIWQLGLSFALLGLVSHSPPSVAAQGDWIVRGGAGYVDPKSDNLELAPNTNVQVDEGISATIEGTYMFADKWGIELLAAWPFKHDIDIDGLGEVAQVEHLPPTLSLQYHFNPEGKFRPYVGVGLNYTTFFDEDTKGALDGSDLKLDDSWGVAAQLGADIAMTGNWFANVGVRWIDIDTDADLDGAGIGKVEIDPWIYQLQIGYRFRRAAPVAAMPVSAPAEPEPAPQPEPPKPVPPADSDGDGVPDSADRCPNTPRGQVVDAQGCACHVTRQIQFKLDSAELTAEGRAMLDELAATLKELGFISGTVTGYTDSSGDEDYNRGLSLRRAEAVAGYLEAQGIAAGRLNVRGMGESDPVADNGTSEGRAMNRRVVISRTDCDKG